MYYYINMLITTFLTIFRRFATTFRRFPKVLQKPFSDTNVADYFPKIAEDNWRLLKASEEDPQISMLLLVSDDTSYLGRVQVQITNDRHGQHTVYYNWMNNV